MHGGALFVLDKYTCRVERYPVSKDDTDCYSASVTITSRSELPVDWRDGNGDDGTEGKLPL
jgi:hypothetical protein